MKFHNFYIQSLVSNFQSHKTIEHLFIYTFDYMYSPFEYKKNHFCWFILLSVTYIKLWLHIEIKFTISIVSHVYHVFGHP